MCLSIFSLSDYTFMLFIFKNADLVLFDDPLFFVLWIYDLIFIIPFKILPYSYIVLSAFSFGFPIHIPELNLFSIFFCFYMKALKAINLLLRTVVSTPHEFFDIDNFYYSSVLNVLNFHCNILFNHRCLLINFEGSWHMYCCQIVTSITLIL